MNIIRLDENDKFYDYFSIDIIDDTEIITKDGKRFTGEIETYGPGNELSMRGMVIEGFREGKWEYYFENGKKKLEENYRDNELEGERITYFNTGKVFQIENYKFGKLDGEKIIYTDYDNNLKYQKMDYVNGKLSGDFIIYNDDGKSVDVIERYVDDKLEGVTEYYDELGNLILKQKFHEDELVSEENF